MDVDSTLADDVRVEEMDVDLADDMSVDVALITQIIDILANIRLND